MKIRYGFRQVGDVEVFYREAGASDAPVILLLHGFPTASHMFRDLIPLLADHFRLVAPDLPGFICDKLRKSANCQGGTQKNVK
jgi:pimeloyl-ACP methyl ester carboxylesterase